MLLELALVGWVVDRLVGEGFTPVVPPVLVRESTMEEAGFFPTDRSQVYEVDGGELFLVGTSEISLSTLHRGEILDVDTLPRRYAGISSCFRREAGTYGKDTTGIFRVHQFDKVEMFSFADPDDVRRRARASARDRGVDRRRARPPVPRRQHRRRRPRRGRGEEVRPRGVAPVRADLPRAHVLLELPGLLGPPSADPHAGRGADGNRLVHTLNGTACAVGRTLVFLWEHYQDPGGAFVVPEPLRSRTGFDRVEPPT